MFVRGLGEPGAHQLNGSGPSWRQGVAPDLGQAVLATLMPAEVGHLAWGARLVERYPSLRYISSFYSAEPSSVRRLPRCKTIA